MSRLISALALLLVAELSGAAQVAAQTGAESGYTAPALDAHWAELDRAHVRSRRVRTALITMTGVFFVGGVLNASWYVSNCNSSESELRCNTDRQPALSGIGAALSSAGAIGMITTGIMLGVRNKKRRDIERRHREQQRFGFHWDFESARFRF